MLPLLAWVACFFGYSIAISSYARRDWPGRDRYATNALLVAGFWAFAVASTRAMYGCFGPEQFAYAVPLFFGMILVAILLALPYATHVMLLLLEAAGRSMSGVDRLPTHPRFDLGDKAMTDRRFGDAISLYLESAEGVPADPEPLRRAGEGALAIGDAGRAVGLFQRALALTEKAEDRASLGFRIAEILEHRLKRRGEARRQLATLAGELRGTRFEGYARTRLDRIS